MGFRLIHILLLGFLAFALFFMVSCASADNVDEEHLKEYFFYRCVNEGHKEIKLKEFDGSVDYIAELLPYDYDVIKKISDFSVKISSEIPISNYNNKKSVLAICLEKYKGKELDALIKQLIQKEKVGSN